MKFSVSEKITALQPQEIIGSKGSINLIKSGWGQNHMRYDFTSSEMALIKKADNGGETRELSHCWQGCRLGQPLWKTGRSPNDHMQSSL